MMPKPLQMRAPTWLSSVASAIAQMAATSYQELVRLFPQTWQIPSLDRWPSRSAQQSPPPMPAPASRISAPAWTSSRPASAFSRPASRAIRRPALLPAPRRPRRMWRGSPTVEPSVMLIAEIGCSGSSGTPRCGSTRRQARSRKGLYREGLKRFRMADLAAMAPVALNAISWLAEPRFALAKYRVFLKPVRKLSSHDQRSSQHDVWPTCGPTCAACIAHNLPGTLGFFCRTPHLRRHRNSAKL
jgi:hypothetical protein